MVLAGLNVLTVLNVLPVIAGCRGFIGAQFEPPDKKNQRDFRCGEAFSETKTQGGAQDF